MPRARPFHIRSGATPLFAVHHPVDPGTAPRRPVLICSPWGWDDIASYRARREWAIRLAAAGHPTLRFDLPATGNSAGTPGAKGIVEGWVAAVAAASSWLSEENGGAAISVLGLGLGGLLAIAAAQGGAPIEELALWGVPRDGKRFVRETGAFSRMQTWNAEDEADFDPGVPEGWIEAGGFALSPATIESLKALTPVIDRGRLRRVLAIDRDGVAVDPKLIAALEAGVADTEVGAGPGWSDFVSHPERSTVPAVVATGLEKWLEASPGATVSTTGGASEREDAVEVGPAGVRETAIVVAQDWGRTLGVLAEPAGARADLCAVFLNAGAVRMVGPSRLWTETARRWAGRGVPSLRVDLQGIGEADGEPAGALQVGDFYVPRYISQVRGVLDELQGRGLGDRFLLVGLCAGGYWAFQTAVADPRVVAGFGVNAGALRWDTDLLVQREARKGGRAFERRSWRKLLRGEIPWSKIAGLLRSLAIEFGRRLVTVGRRLAGRPVEDGLKGGIEADLDSLERSGTGVLLAFSGREALGEEVAADGLADHLDRWPRADFADLPGNDHTLRPLSVQRAARELLDAELDRLLDASEGP